MFRPVLFLLLASLLPAPCLLHASNDGPPIAITSPDTAVTFAYGTIKSHALIWDNKRKLLIAQVVFVDSGQTDGQAVEDEHEFRLPGISFDETKGVFYAVSAKGETIPVAQIKKSFFLKTIEVLPNADVRVVHPHGNVTVILEAISPGDPAMHAAPPDTNPDGGHKVDISKILQ